ncbi:MAG: helix-turn-helix transcriptional regulator [Lentisphaeria bacterium]|nr:AraC family transcriptional regulator [Lentisphaerota bacterium]MBR7146083.1 helix-turn-helix transcriptional regulator [Lentisphaeria bacterium]
MNFINCHLLHWSYEKHAVPEVPEHVHSYYQIELCVHGAVRFTSSATRPHLHSGDWMLIPPGTTHSMIYEGRDLEYYSFKFEVNGLNARMDSELFFHARDPLSDWVIASLAALRPPDRYLYMPINENRIALEALLLSMFQQTLMPIANRNGKPRILRDISAMIAEEGAKVNIQRAAEQMQMNVSQLKYRCKLALQEYSSVTGKKLTLKEYLDRELMKHIDRLLIYSDMPLGDISSQTMFNNIYTFSRFVKRLTGETPSQRRNKSGNAEIEILPE